jgi:hypothetical protein
VHVAVLRQEHADLGIRWEISSAEQAQHRGVVEQRSGAAVQKRCPAALLEGQPACEDRVDARQHPLPSTRQPRSDLGLGQQLERLLPGDQPSLAFGDVETVQHGHDSDASHFLTGCCASMWKRSGDSLMAK